MDTPNLAVCMAPNILHNSTKAEKMNSESKLLHVSRDPALPVFLVVCAPLNCYGLIRQSLNGAGKNGSLYIMPKLHTATYVGI